MCKICDIINEGIESIPPSPFDENDFNRITNGVWIGEFTVDNLPLPTYLKTADFLKSGLSLGMAEYEKVDELLVADLTENIYLFSGAKTYQEVRTLTSMLADHELKSNFYKFKEAAKPVLHDYNVAYLQTEYNTAKGSGRMAAFWDRIKQEADVLPLLQYQTVGDARVRPTHQALDNIIRPVNDAFWRNYYPPNGWRCRCTVMQLSEGTLTDLTDFVKPDDVPDEFMMNTGIDGYVFKEKGKGKHPYFDVAKGDKENAKKNWNLPIPKAPKPAPIIEVPKTTLQVTEADYLKAANADDRYKAALNSEKMSTYTPAQKTINAYAERGFQVNYAHRDNLLGEIDSLFSKNLSIALDELESYKGTVYRGINDNDGSILSSLKSSIGKSIEWNGFTSTSMSKQKVLDAYINKNSILFEIESKTGKNIVEFSNIKSEQEILFNLKSKFIVKEIKDDIVYLKEI